MRGCIQHLALAASIDHGDGFDLDEPLRHRKRRYTHYSREALPASTICAARYVSVSGSSRHLACALQSGRFQIKADIKRQAGPAGSVENDPEETSALTNVKTVCLRRAILRLTRQPSDGGSHANRSY